MPWESVRPEPFSWKRFRGCVGRLCHIRSPLAICCLFPLLYILSFCNCLLLWHDRCAHLIDTLFLFVLWMFLNFQVFPEGTTTNGEMLSTLVTQCCWRKKSAGGGDSVKKKTLLQSISWTPFFIVLDCDLLVKRGAELANIHFSFLEWILCKT